MAITYQGAGTEASATGGANITLTYPAGIAAGDLIWVSCSSSVATAYATNALSGFTRAYAFDSGGGSPVGAGFLRIATGAESGNITLVTPGGSSFARMFVYRGVEQTTPLDSTPVNFGSSTAVTAYVVPEQTTTVPGCTLLVHAWSNSATGTWTPPTLYTELWDSNAAGTVGAVEFAHRVAWSGSGATGTRTITRSAAVRGGAAGVVLRPAADTITGSVNATVPKLTAAIAASVTVLAVSAPVLPRPTTSATATVTNPATTAVALPRLKASTTGTVTNRGSVAATLPKIGSSAAVNVTNRGSAAVTLPRLSASATGGLGVAASVNATLPTLTATVAVDMTVTSVIAARLPLPTAIATVELTATADIDATLPAPTGSVDGDVVIDPASYRDITITLGQPYTHPLAVGSPLPRALTIGTPYGNPLTLLAPKEAP